MANAWNLFCLGSNAGAVLDHFSLLIFGNPWYFDLWWPLGVELTSFYWWFYLWPFSWLLCFLPPCFLTNQEFVHSSLAQKRHQVFLNEAHGLHAAVHNLTPELNLWVSGLDLGDCRISHRSVENNASPTNRVLRIKTFLMIMMMVPATVGSLSARYVLSVLHGSSQLFLTTTLNWILLLSSSSFFFRTEDLVPREVK